jgi:DNA-directed RNA polymerase specialized sigma24 family protein
MTDAYFKRAIKQAGRHDFRKLYKVQDSPIENIPEEHDIDRRICIERIDVVIRQLDEFDRQIFELYLRGQNMVELSRQSKIPISTIYHTLSKVRQLLKQYA